MPAKYNDNTICFSIQGARIHALNIVYDRFMHTIPNHTHGSGSYEIHYIPQGYGRAHINGKAYEITPNTLFVTGPHIEHTQTPYQDDPMCEYCIYLKIEKGRRMQTLSSYEDERKILAIFENTSFWFGQDCQNVETLVRELFDELQIRAVGYEIQVRSLLKQLMVKLVRNYEQETKAAINPAYMPASDMASVIIEEYFLYQYRSLSLEELAHKLNLGVRQTERLLLKQYGKTFLQKKTEARMSVAAILLADTGKTISVVAEELGYSCIEHFSSSFKNYFHVSPRQYRKENTCLAQGTGSTSLPAPPN